MSLICRAITCLSTDTWGLFAVESALTADLETAELAEVKANVSSVTELLVFADWKQPVGSAHLADIIRSSHNCSFLSVSITSILPRE